MEQIYGIFRNRDDSITILPGEVTNRAGELITVNYNGNRQSYLESDIGKTLFRTEDEAEERAEELSRRRRFT